MSDKFEQFQAKYPNLFRQYPRSGFDLRPGWETLVHCLCHVLECEIKRLPEEVRADVQCAQVKEKFGGLRFYMTSQSPAMDGAISVAESMSFHLCETCGKPGKPRQGGWILTLCDEHHEENQRVRQIAHQKWVAEHPEVKDDEDE